MAPIDFAIFLTAHNADAARELAPMIAACIQSLRRSHPDSTIHLLTDETTRLNGATVGATPIVVAPRVEAAEILLERTRAYRGFLDRAEFRRDIVFLDHDMIANRPLGRVFDLAFDLAFTYRTWTKRYPINGGFIAVRY